MQQSALPYLKLLAPWSVWQLDRKAASKSDMTYGMVLVSKYIFKGPNRGILTLFRFTIGQPWRPP